MNVLESLRFEKLEINEVLSNLSCETQDMNEGLANRHAL